MNHAAAAYDALAGCDVAHDHTPAGLFIAQIRRERPVVTTNHGPFVELLADVYRRTEPVVPLIAISEDQARSAPADIPVAAVIHHGLDLDRHGSTTLRATNWPRWAASPPTKASTGPSTSPAKPVSH